MARMGRHYEDEGMELGRSNTGRKAETVTAPLGGMTAKYLHRIPLYNMACGPWAGLMKHFKPTTHSRGLDDP